MIDKWGHMMFETLVHRKTVTRVTQQFSECKKIFSKYTTEELIFRICKELWKLYT